MLTDIGTVAVAILQGWFSPGQVFVLDEYCARYGVRGCKRHLSYLNDLLNSAERSTMIDPTLMHYSFAFCASHVHGHRYVRIRCSANLPDGFQNENIFLSTVLS